MGTRIGKLKLNCGHRHTDQTQTENLPLELDFRLDSVRFNEFIFTSGERRIKIKSNKYAGYMVLRHVWLQMRGKSSGTFAADQCPSGTKSLGLLALESRVPSPKTTEHRAGNPSVEELASADIISLLSASRTRLTGAQARAANAFIRLAKILSQPTTSLARSSERLANLQKKLYLPAREDPKQNKAKHK